MTYFEDLTEYTYHQSFVESGTRNIGWLDTSVPFPKGEVDTVLTNKILKLVANPVNKTRGFHVCPFCSSAPFGLPVIFKDKQILLGSAEIRVKSKSGITYASPDLIYHYIKDHKYLPPKIFLDALSDISV